MKAIDLIKILLEHPKQEVKLQEDGLCMWSDFTVENINLTRKKPEATLRDINKRRNEKGLDSIDTLSANLLEKWSINRFPIEEGSDFESEQIFSICLL